MTEASTSAGKKEACLAGGRAGHYPSVRPPSCLHRRSLLLAAAFAPLACASAELPPSRASRHLGSALPAFTGTTVNGLEFDSNASRGLVLLVEFFDCRAGSSSLTNAAELYANNRELVIVGVSLDDSIERTRAFASGRSIRFPVLFDPDRSLAARVGVTEPGTSLAVDRRGMPGGQIVQAAGPWRSSGEWWHGATGHWDRDEWDVSFSDGASCRLFRERDSGRWFIEGMFD